MATVAKIALPSFMAVVIGFMVGWWFEFSRLMREHRPNGCDGPCLFLASEYHDDALWVAVGAALVLGLLVFGVAVLVFARRRSAPRPSQNTS